MKRLLLLLTLVTFLCFQATAQYSKHTFYGISPMFDTQAPNGEEASYYQRMGLETVRIHALWDFRGNNWDGYYNTINWYVSRGIRVLVLISYSSYPSTNSGGDYSNDPRLFNNGNVNSPYYGSDGFIYQTGEIMKKFSSWGVHDFEIWNEPNGAQYYLAPDKYAKLLTEIYLRKGMWDPNATICYAGIDASYAPGDPNGTNGLAVSHTQNVHNSGVFSWAKSALGGLPYDALGVHPYGAHSYTHFYNNIQTYVNISNGAKNPSESSKPIWITEMGNNQPNDNLFFQYNWDVLSHARTNPYVARYYLFKYRYVAPGYPDFENFGLVGPNRNNDNSADDMKYHYELNCAFWGPQMRKASPNQALGNSNALEELSIYPNPATGDKIIVPYTEPNTAYQIIDLTGKQVAQGNMMSNTIHIDNLSNGIYFLRIKKEDGRFISKRFLKN